VQLEEARGKRAAGATRVDIVMIDITIKTKYNFENIVIGFFFVS